MRRRELRLESAVGRVSPRGGPLSHPITSITNNAGNPLVTTPTPHGLSGSETLLIAGTGVYDGPDSILGINSPTTFTLSQDYVSDTTGGTFTVI